LQHALAVNTLSNVVVKQYVQSAAAIQVGSTMEACMIASGSDKRKVASCRNTTKAMLFTTLGEAKGSQDASDADAKLQRYIRKAAGERFVERIQACMEAKMGDCTAQGKQAARVALGSADSTSDVDSMSILEDGAAGGGKNKMKACRAAATTDTETADCMTSVMDSVKVMVGGKLDEYDFKRFMNKGAEDEIVEYAEACFSEGCNEDEFKNKWVHASGERATGKIVQSGNALDKTAIAKAKRAGAKSMIRKAFQACKDIVGISSSKSKNKAQVEQCVKQQIPAYSSVSSVANQAVDMRSAVQESAQDRTIACANAGTDPSKCLSEVTTAMANELNSTDVRDALLRARADAYRSTALCSNKTAQSCSRAAVNRTLQMGAKAREQISDQKLNALRSAAQMHSDCTAASNSASECSTQAREEFIASKGAANEWTKKEKAVRRLSAAFLRGDVTKIVRNKSLDVNFCNALACTEAKQLQYQQIAGLKANATGGELLPGGSQSSQGTGCCTQFIILMPGKSDSEIEAAADLVVAVKGRRLLGSSESIYASQSVTECPSQGCDSAIPSPPPQTPTPSPPPQSAPMPTSTPVPAGSSSNSSTPIPSPSPEGSSAGNSSSPSPTQRPETVKITRVVQSVSTTAIADAQSYKGDIQTVFETGYSISIGIWNAVAKSLTNGCTLSSSAQNARRGGVKISFEASVIEALAAAAESKTKAMASNPAALVSAIQQAAVQLNKNVTVPSASEMTISAPEITVKDSTVIIPTALVSDGIGLGFMVVFILVGVAVVGGGVGFAVYYLKKSKADPKVIVHQKHLQDEGPKLQKINELTIDMGDSLAIGVLGGGAQDTPDDKTPLNSKRSKLN